MALKAWVWLESKRYSLEDRLHREDGEFAMEWAVISGIVLAAAIAAYTAAPGKIKGIIDAGFAKIVVP
jgi:hypothetical protein